MTIHEPPNESERLEALRQYSVLDTPAEKAFDDFTLLASFICKVPIALISFVDGDRQWFKSTVGLDVSETPRDLAFCAHTILENKVMVVHDATIDARFAHNPLVTGDPKIRFYAGAPLITPEGYGLGTLCVIDRKPRVMSEPQKKALAALARQIVIHLELRRVSTKLAEALDKIKLMGDLIPICSFCKNVRNDQGFWSTVERFISEYSAADFTHGFCPDCIKKHYPDVLCDDESETDN